MPLLALLALAAWLAVPAQAQATIGPDSVWDQQRTVELDACLGRSWDEQVRCLPGTLEAAGAHPAAADFVRQFQQPAMLMNFQEMGLVDRGVVFYPGRANDNWQEVLLNGWPNILQVADLLDVDLRGDPLYPALIGRYRQMLLWAGHNRFSRQEGRPGGGQRIVYDAPLLDGCHACETVGAAVVALDFDASGNFLGSTLLGLATSRPPPAHRARLDCLCWPR